jgi:hypothetical protein
MPEGTIGWAIEMMRNGHAVARYGWNGKDLSCRLQTPDEHSKMTKPYVYIEYPNGDRVPWLASQTDLLADDWYIASLY